MTRTEHAQAAQSHLRQASSGSTSAMESAKVEATLAIAAALSEIAQNLYRIK